MTNALQAICVFCGSSDSVNAEYITAARKLGDTLARRKIRLVFGGGKTGLMGAVADGALEAGGEVVGVITPGMNTMALAHQGLTRMDVAAEMHARKARMHELCDGYIALPGGFGTFDELFETITWGQIGAHAKPVGILNVRDYFTHLLAAIDHATDEGFIMREHRESLRCDSDLDALLDWMGSYEHPHAAVKRWLREE